MRTRYYCTALASFAGTLLAIIMLKSCPGCFDPSLQPSRISRLSAYWADNSGQSAKVIGKSADNVGQSAKVIGKSTNNGVQNDPQMRGNEDEGEELLVLEPERFKYPRRNNMSECKPLFGKVTVFVAVVNASYQTHYGVAQRSLECYLRSVNYTFLLIDLDNDRRTNKACNHTQLFFKKHCAAAEYLKDTDWMLVLDADTGVVNPNHCIEEFIDNRVNIVFYERFFNWEVAAGNYLVKNTQFSHDFLMKWADWQFHQPSNWNGADNGVLQILILETVMPEAREEIKACDAVWHRGTDYDTYMAYVTCVKVFIGAKRLWPDQLRILRRAHGWVRDWYLTSDNWSDFDFMLHGWKLHNIGESGWQSPFTNISVPEECGRGYEGWNWREERRRPIEVIQKMIAGSEFTFRKNFPSKARDIPYLTEPDIAKCYPHCDENQ